MFEKLA